MAAIHRLSQFPKGSIMLAHHGTPSGDWVVLKAWLMAAVAVVTVAGPLLADDTAVVEPAAAVEAAPRPDRHPELTRLSKTEDVWVDREQEEVVVGGTIALADGVIEVFACPQHSKEHEAIVATRSTARLVHAALLAIGLKPGKPVSFDPEYAGATGPVVKVRMRWKDADGIVQERPAQELIRNTKTNEALDTDWVFTGSVFWKDPTDGTDYYQADGGDMICVSNFPTAMLDLPIESSQANDALLFEAFAGRVPPRGSEVELILSAEQRRRGASKAAD